MAENSSSAELVLSREAQLERLIWATRPMGLILIVLWALHPATVDHSDYVRMALIGFLVGTFYGLVVYGQKLREYIFVNNTNQRTKPNRVPEEYYWGNIIDTMYDNQ